MRILFLGQQSLTSPSGLGRHWPLAKALVESGHQVRILTLHHDFVHLTERRSVQEGVEVWYVGQMQVLKRGGQKRYFSTPRLLQLTAKAVVELYRAIVQSLSEGFEVVHLMKPQPVNGLAWLGYHYLSPIQKIGKQQTPIRFFLDCDDHETGSIANRHAALQQAVHWFEQKMPPLAQAITYNTAATKARLVAQGITPQKLIYLPNGIDRSRFAQQDEALEASLRQQFAPHEENLLLYVGTLSMATHDVDLLLQAFASIHQQHPNTRLLLVGGGEDADALQQQAHAMGLTQQILFVGPVDPSHIPSYLRIAHLSVEPTRTTTAALGRSPLKIVESLAAGTPIVCGAVGERISTLKTSENSLCGLLVKPNDAGALANGMMLILTQPRLSASLRIRGLERAKNFYWDRLAPIVEQAYESKSRATP